MGKMHDKEYLKRRQYVDSHNLEARIAIHANFSTGKETWNDFIFRNLQLRSGMNTLALGCGNATQWQANHGRFPEKASIILSDLSYGMLKEAQAGFSPDQKVTFTVADAQQIPFIDNHFDLASANHMLYHVPNISSVLLDIRRVLKPNGVLMAATNGESHMAQLYSLLAQFCSAYQPEDEKHSRFSIENGTAILKKFFRFVKFLPFLSDLWVTDSRTLVGYVYSMWDADGVLDENFKPDLQEFFDDEIALNGGIFIQKSTGIFLASDSEEKLSSYSAA